MDIQFERGLAKLVCSGKTTIEDAREAFQHCAQHEEFDENTPMLIDDRASSYQPQSPKGTEASQVLSSFQVLRGHRIAVLVSSETNFGFSHMIETLAPQAGFEMMAFTELSEAEAWLWGE